jgi:hypothetical protein
MDKGGLLDKNERALTFLRIESLAAQSMSREAFHIQTPQPGYGTFLNPNPEFSQSVAELKSRICVCA